MRIPRKEKKRDEEKEGKGREKKAKVFWRRERWKNGNKGLNRKKRGKTLRILMKGNKKKR